MVSKRESKNGDYSYVFRYYSLYSILIIIEICIYIAAYPLFCNQYFIDFYPDISHIFLSIIIKNDI